MSLMYNRTIEMNSFFSKAYRCKGAIFLYDIGMYDKALQLNPFFAKAYNDKGNEDICIIKANV